MDYPNVLGADGMMLGKPSQDGKTRIAKPVCIHHGGHEFVASSEMAGIFLRHVQGLIDDGDTQLVPLLHRDGVELLLVSAETPVSVHAAFDDSATASGHGQGQSPIRRIVPGARESGEHFAAR